MFSVYLVPLANGQHASSGLTILNAKSFLKHRK